MARFERTEHVLALALVRGVRKGAAQLTPAAEHVGLDIVREGAPAPRRQRQRLWLTGLLEVVDVAPVGGGWPLMRHAIETSLQRHEAPRPWLTGNVEVIANVLNAERELHRLFGAGLAEHALRRREARGRLEPQTLGNRDLSKLFRCKIPLAPPV